MAKAGKIMITTEAMATEQAPGEKANSKRFLTRRSKKIKEKKKPRNLRNTRNTLLSLLACIITWKKSEEEDISNGLKS